VRSSILIQADDSLWAVEPTCTAPVAFVIVYDGIKSAPATSLTSRTNHWFGVRRLWHFLPALWLGIYLIYQTDTRPLRAFKKLALIQAIKRYDSTDRGTSRFGYLIRMSIFENSIIEVESFWSSQ
jgi:hypothetical protein